MPFSNHRQDVRRWRWFQIWIFPVNWAAEKVQPFAQGYKGENGQNVLWNRTGSYHLHHVNAVATVSHLHQLPWMKWNEISFIHGTYFIFISFLVAFISFYFIPCGTYFISFHSLWHLFHFISFLAALISFHFIPCSTYFILFHFILFLAAFISFLVELISFHFIHGSWWKWLCIYK